MDYITTIIPFFSGCATALVSAYVVHRLAKQRDEESLLRKINFAKMELNNEIDMNWTMLEELIAKINCSRPPAEWSSGLEGRSLEYLFIKNLAREVFPVWEKSAWNTYRSIVGLSFSEQEFKAVSKFYMLIEKLKISEHAKTVIDLVYVMAEIYGKPKPTLILKPHL